MGFGYSARPTYSSALTALFSKGHESFASHDSLEQLHRLMFVLAVTHVSYSFAAIALALIKIYSWRSWENQAKSLALQSFEG
ncbi:MLO-like protein 11 [Linum grandiflorum]